MYQLLRLLFLLFNLNRFTDLSFARYLYISCGSIRFDIAALIYINFIYILGMLLPFPFRGNRGYQKSLNYIFLVTNSIGILANLADIAYFPFILRRTDASFFLEFRNDTNLLGEIVKYMGHYWYLTIIFILMIYLLHKFINRKFEPVAATRSGYLPHLFHSLIFVFVAGLCLAGVRGTFHPESRPINMGNAIEFREKPLEVNLVLNTPFSILFTWGINQIPDKKYFSDIHELENNYNPVQIFKGSSPKNTNVVVIIVESLSREFVGALNCQDENYKSYTPFLDSLIGYCYTSPSSFANGRKSIEALPSVIASIPTLHESFVTTQYTRDEFRSLAHVLKERNYSTSFYHGAHNGSMGFWAFMKSAGFEKYYGRDDFNDDNFYDGTWGIWDEQFLQYWADNLDKEKQPFLSCLFTVTSHSPYAIPDQYKDRFNKGEHEIQNSISYTDHSLRMFFNRVKHSPWFKNTLFVITSDHTASQNYVQRYISEVGNYSAVVLFYTPDGSVQPKMIPDPIQQTDIYPSVVDYLDLNDTIVAFGRSVFDSTANTKPIVVCRQGLYQLLTDSLVLQYDGDKENVLAMYNYRTDPGFNSNLAGTRKEELDKDLKILKAYVQQYTSRVRTDRLMPGR